MLLLTGATGLVGSALLRRLVAEEQPVRCLVRDPRQLGTQRVRVQIALGDLTDPPSFRNAMRGVNTVVHLAGSTRDQPRGSIEDLTAMATWRMVDAAQRVGVERFVFFSLLGASEHHRSRLFRAKAIAERAVGNADLRSTIIAPSLVYAPGDRWLKLLEHLSRLPFVPIPGPGRAVCQPIWAEDIAECTLAILRSGGQPAATERYELAGPDTLTYNDVIHTALHALNRERPLLHVPKPLASRALRALERTTGANTPLTPDEAGLLQANMFTKHGTADAQALGVTPQPMSAVLAH
jgi:NADH dehydrogenase